MCKSLDSLIEKIIGFGMAAESDIQGCRETEIRSLQSQLGLSLPPIYRHFLRVCGKGAGSFLIGTDWTYSSLIENQKAASRLLHSCGLNPLPRDAFVFSMHQGYSFLFFICDGHDDPAVFLFVEGDQSPRKVFDQFSAWFAQCIVDEGDAFDAI